MAQLSGHYFATDHPFHAVEQEIAGLAAQFDDIAGYIGKRFIRSEPRARAMAYLKGLLSSVERKNGWQLAEEAGEYSPDNFQHLLNRSDWEADAVRDDLQDYVEYHLGDQRAVLVIDETGFLKKGNKSAGVARQYSGTAGRIENSQIGVFLAYVSSKGHTLIDRELYLPKEWTDDPQRCREARVPESTPFATKPQLAKQMLARAVAAGLPFAWVTADEVYGQDGRLRLWLEGHSLRYVLAINSNTALWQGFSQPRVKALVATAGPEHWHRISAGNGSKGPRMYEWALLPLNGPPIAGWQRWLLVRRSLEKPNELAYYLVCAESETPLVEMVKVAGSRWAIEECFESAKGEVGLDQYEVRLYPAWYRHITLAMWAHAYLTVVRSQAQLEIPVKGGSSSRGPGGSLQAFKQHRGLNCP